MIDTISGQVRAAAVSEIVLRPGFQDPSAKPTFLGCAAQSIPITLSERAEFDFLAKASPYVGDTSQIAQFVVLVCPTIFDNVLEIE